MAGARTDPTLAGQIREAARLMETTGQGVFFTDAQQRILHVNPSFCRLTGFAASEVIGRTPTVFASGRHSRDFYEAMWRSIDEDGHWGGEVWDRRKDGEPLALWLNVGAIKNPAGEVCHYLVVFSDITARKETEDELQHRANHDALTGLPNRALFKERLEHALLRAQRYQLNIAVLFLDLDHFKEINLAYPPFTHTYHL